MRKYLTAPAVALLVGAIGAALAKTAPDLGKLRPATPSNGLEGRDFWRAYAKRDLKRKLKDRDNTGVAKNVVIFVGDGMGIQTVTMSRIYKGQKLVKEGKAGAADDRNGEGSDLVWERFPYTGLSKTYNINYQVADSASTACALFNGVKTKFGVTGVDGTIERGVCDRAVYEAARLEGMLHWSQAAGKATGFISTARVTHATPANLYAGSVDRNWEHDGQVPDDDECHPDIAKQMVENEASAKANLIFGGGRQNFRLARGSSDADPGKRADEDLTDKWQRMKQEQGDSYRYLQTKGDLKKWVADGGTDYVLGLFSPSHMSYEIDRDDSDDGQPALSDMVAAAVDRLKKDDDGFFLMVESGRIDHAHHATNAKRAMEETYEMENAVQAVLDRVDLEDTLIIITADHSHSVTINGYPPRGNPILGFMYEDPLALSEYPDGTKLAYATISYANGPGFFNHFANNSNIPWKDMRGQDYENKDFLQPAMMPGPEKDESHGGEDVGIYAVGPMAHLLTGVHEENFIAHLMAYSSCVGDYKDDCDRPSSSARAAAHPGAILLMLAALALMRAASAL